MQAYSLCRLYVVLYSLHGLYSYTELQLIGKTGGVRMQDDENVKNPDNIIEIPEDAFTSKESREKAGFTSSLGAQKPPKSRNRAVVCLIAAASRSITNVRIHSVR